ncbi:MAG: DUF2934 domain-containing protein [Candidatus Aureabacteria bacterium]|nr:DUF2934 domain-containing protein [Candidatus Auribacterota bacterium]
MATKRTTAVRKTKKKAVVKTVKKAAVAVKKTVQKTAQKNITLTQGQLAKLIEERAYELYCERGCSHGDNQHDWYIAEKEVLKKSKIKN